MGTCCGGTGMENHTKYQDSVYFRSADESTLYVNLYIDSTLRWQEKGFTVIQTTKYPTEGESRLTLNGSGPLEIKLRVPPWAGKGYAVRINGYASKHNGSSWSVPFNPAPMEFRRHHRYLDAVALPRRSEPSTIPRFNRFSTVPL